MKFCPESRAESDLAPALRWGDDIVLDACSGAQLVNPCAAAGHVNSDNRRLDKCRTVACFFCAYVAAVNCCYVGGSLS